MSIAKFLCLAMGLLLVSCSDKTMHLPKPVSNNAVAYHEKTQTVYSFAGLGAGKTWRDVTAAAYACDVAQKTCKTIAPLPDGVGRLASTAQVIGDRVYIMGGYSVAEDGTEISMPEVWAYDMVAGDGESGTYTRKADMPVPVDDSVSLVYQDRYIYLVSGWHKDDNVVNVQVYDSQKNTWAPASDWPGVPVFGHAGGIVGNVMVVCDGVQIVPPQITPKTKDARRTFEAIRACWRGNIDADKPTKITWRKLPQLPGKGNYRMAATGWVQENMIVFAGGSDNPYNYNGIGYDKTPSQPSQHVWGYDIAGDKYVLFADKPHATMDHRALVHLGENEFLTLGGMGAGQAVLDQAHTFKIKPVKN